MSELINNLNTIYNAKLAIKQAIGTESDNLLDYASYISTMVPAPEGTSYLTTNGLYDISTYAYVDVDVENVIPPGYTYVYGTYNISENGTFDISSYENTYVNVSGETIAQKNAAWQTKWANALSTVAAGLYAQDPSYGEPQISDPSGWCIQTAIDGNAAMSELIAMACLWIEIYGGQYDCSSMLHEQYVQIFTQMGLNLDSDGYLVSTDDDKIIPFDADEAIVTNYMGVNGYGAMGGKRISSLNGGIENTKWNYYGAVFNGTGFDYVYISQLNYVVDQFAMITKMTSDGVTFINNIPAVDQTTLLNYLIDFQLNEYTPYQTMNITTNGTHDVSGYANAYVNVQAPTPAPTFMSISDILNSSTNLTGITTVGRYTSSSPYNYIYDSNSTQLNINGGPDGESKVRTVIYGDYDQSKQLFNMYSYLMDD